MRIVVEPHPLLQLGAFVATWPTPLGESTPPPWLVAMLTSTSGAVPDDADPRVREAITQLGGSDDTVRTAVRKLLRHGGYKPSGRGKPASEYLLAAADEHTLGSINLAVDLCNAVSLHAGLPISVVDLGRATEPLRVAIAADDASYVFNPTGQEIKLAGLLCLHDAQGPCANAVKDAQRTKTQADTTRVVCIVWGARELADRTAKTLDVYRELTLRTGATIEPVE
jgi:DNA/RNA-binding domain of Phe-tRNA-synthetase-like protein